MAARTFSGRQFKYGSSKPRKAAKACPAFITDRRQTAHVLLTSEECKRPSGPRTSIADLLTMPGVEHAELDIPAWPDLAQSADLH